MLDVRERDGIQYTLKSIYVFFACFCVAFLLNEMNILYVRKDIMRMALVAVVFFCMISVVIVYLKHLQNNRYVKYILMTFIILMTFMTNILLNVHTMLIMIFPIIIASYYKSKTINAYTTILTAISIPVSICLAIKMGTFHISFFAYIVKQLSPEWISDSVNMWQGYASWTDNPIVKVLVFYCGPNTGIAILFGVLVSNIRKYREESQKKQMILEMEKEHIEEVMKQYMDPRFVGRVLKEDLLNNQNIGETQHTTVMFADISGFTSMVENQNPETAMTILNKYLTMIGECVVKNGGTIDKYIGDCVMSIWIGSSNEINGEYNACKTALEIQKSVEKMRPEIERLVHCELKVNIGINSGDATIGRVGSRYRADYTAVGDTVNVASRIQQLGEDGVIYITKAVKSVTGDLFIYGPELRKTVKGRTEETEFYELLNVAETKANA